MTAEEYLERGNEKSEKGLIQEAIDDYTKAIEINLQYAGAYNNRGNSFADLKKYEEAIKDFSKAIEINPQYATAYYNRGISFADLKKYEEAITDYTKAIEIDPKYIVAYNNRGNSFADLKKYEEAIDDYTKAIEINPQDATVYYNRGVSFANLKKYEEAINDYNKAIEINPQDEAAYYNHGVCSNNLKKDEEAINDYTKAIEINPQHIGAYNNRGNSLDYLKKYEEAIDDYTKAIEIDPKYTRAYNNRGNSFANLKKYEEAIRDYKKVIELDPDSFRARSAQTKIDEINAIIEIPKEEQKKVVQTEKIISEIKNLLTYTDNKLTHYTSAQALQYIIFDKTKFRLSEGTFMNDPSEGDVLLDYLKISTSKESPLKAVAFSPKPFIGSFVSPILNNDLTLWRYYGKDLGEEAAGCSITIDCNQFLDDLKAEVYPKSDSESEDKNINNNFDFSFYRVIYLEKDKAICENSGIQNKINKKLSKLKELTEGTTEEMILEKLYEISYLFKTAAYCHESEVRLVISSGFKKEFDTSRFPPRVYIELIPLITSIKEIFIGPKTIKAEELQAAIYHYFKENKYDIPDINISTLPFK